MASSLSVPAPAPAVWQALLPAWRPGNVGGAGQLSGASSACAFGSTGRRPFLGIGVMSVAPLLLESAIPQSPRHSYRKVMRFMQDATGNTAMLVSSLRHGKIVDIKVLRPLTVDSDHVLQLWALPRDTAPIPLGLVPAQGKGSLTLTATSEELLSKVSELAVTVEPKASAPVAQPSGPFILRGPCAKFW